ncbi:hypothetical protein SUGI_0202110 [Cryptomeria japonica]|nr:hypothetical protein SUGI_0202110 [Cryptomeria japonica]
MSECSCWCWTSVFCGTNGGEEVFTEYSSEPFQLPAPLPDWPSGTGFATGSISLGEIQVAQVCTFEKVWSCYEGGDGDKGATFYKPTNLPTGYFNLGYLGQPNRTTLDAWVFVAKETDNSADLSCQCNQSCYALEPPTVPLIFTKDSKEFFPQRGSHSALAKPLNYTLVWSSDSWSGDQDGYVYFWLPYPPEGYKALGFVVTNTGDKPSVEEVRPKERGMQAKGIHALVQHYGPTIYFHPDEVYLPSSVEWFFENGALLYDGSSQTAEPITTDGSNLPQGGSNDGKYWLDLPNDGRAGKVKKGNLESAEVYVHVKPMLGGTFTDIAMWIFCPFNGPVTAKIGVFNLPFERIGEHVSDWEHFTLRISNCTGKLCKMYFSQHSGGEWVSAPDLEYIEGNKATVYSSKSGHASFPHAGDFLQGNSKRGLGIRNDAARSKYSLDASLKYKIVAAEYMHSLGANDLPLEPSWLGYIREWGPTIVYDSRAEIRKLVRFLPAKIRHAVEDIFNMLPNELGGEEGPTGPKEKDNWEGDERS